MMKKILSIFAVTMVLFVMTGVLVTSVKAVDCADLNPPSCSGGTDCPSGMSCVTDGGNCSCKTNASRFTPAGPTDCIKVGSDFTMRLTNDGTPPVRFLTGVQAGAIVGSQAMDSKNCPSLINVTTPIATKCSVVAIGTNPIGANGIKKDSVCVLPKGSEIGMVGMLSVVYTVTRWVFYILTLVAVLMIIYGGFVYITAAGDPAKATTAKSILTFAIIGLAIALLAKFIPSLVRFILGV